MKAIWKNTILAESNDTAGADSEQYFPRGSVNTEFLRPSLTEGETDWKGTRSFYDVVVDEEVNPDAAWFYSPAGPKAKDIEDMIAFGSGVEVVE